MICQYIILFLLCETRNGTARRGLTDIHAGRRASQHHQEMTDENDGAGFEIAALPNYSGLIFVASTRMLSRDWCGRNFGNAMHMHLAGLDLISEPTAMV